MNTIARRTASCVLRSAKQPLVIDIKASRAPTRRFTQQHHLRTDNLETSKPDDSAMWLTFGGVGVLVVSGMYFAVCPAPVWVNIMLIGAAANLWLSNEWSLQRP